jgi:ribosomal protein S17E
MKSIYQILIYLFFIASALGCVNLKAVNDYSKNSKETIQAFNNANILLIDSYKHQAVFKCMFDDTGVRPIGNETDCYDKEALASYKKSDSLISVVNTVLEKYFQALEELSNDESSSFELKSENIRNILSDSTEFNISTDKIDAAGGLVNELTNAALSVYKKKQLVKIIADAHQDLEKVIELNQQIMVDIKKILSSSRKTSSNLYQNIYPNTSSYAEKVYATQNFIDESNEWNAKIEIVEKYMKALSEISEGHEELVKNGKNIKTKDVIQHIAGYTTKIIEIKNEITKLKSNE